MKNFSKVILVIFVLLGSLNANNKFEQLLSGKNQPSWIKELPVEKGYIFEVGISKQNKGGDKSFQHTEAMSDAMRKLTDKIGKKVISVLYRVSKPKTEQEKQGVYQIMTKITETTFKKVKVSGIYTNEDEVVYILVKVATSDLGDTIKKMVK